MTTTVEYGYLGNASVEKGGTASRQLTLAEGEPIYTPYAEDVWAKELIGPDGRFRFMKTSRAYGRGANNALDAVLADNFTVLCLSRPETNVAYATCMSKGSYGSTEWFGLYPMGGAARGALFNVNHSGVSSKAIDEAGSRKPGNWQWQVCARSGGAMTLWSDGKKITGTDSVTTPIGNTNLLLFDTQYRVNIACAMIYDRVLTDAEVQNLIAGAVSPKSVDGLVGYYKFNEPAGTVCTDYSGAGNHLTYQVEYSGAQEEWSPDGNLARAIVAGSAAWSVPTGCTISDEGLRFTPSAGAATFGVNADLVTGQSYVVSYDIAEVSAGAVVRVLLYGPGGPSVQTDNRTTDGTNITQTLKIAGSGVASKIGVQNLTPGSTALVSNLKVIPLTSVGGRAGQPYVTRLVRSPTNWWENLPPKILSPQSVGSLLTGINTTVSVVDGGAGDSSHINLANKDLSIAGWIKIMGTTGKNTNTWTLLHRSGNAEYRFDVAADGKALTLARSSQNAIANLTRPIPFNSWVHIAVVEEYATGIAKFYVNKVFVGSGAMSGTLSTSYNGGIGIGSIAAPRVAQVRSVRLLFRTLGEDEIATLFDTDTLPNTSELIGEWMCNDPSVPYLKDSSGNGRHTATFGAGSSIVLDSPYAPHRRKRRGKQLAVPGFSAININGTALPALLHGQQTITLSGWVRCPLGSARTQRLNLINVPAAARQIVSLSQNVFLSPQPILARAGVDAVVYAGAVYSPIANTEWHLWAIDFDCVNKTCNVYYDGVRIGSPVVGMTTTTGSGFDLTTDGTTMATQLRVCNPNSSSLVGSYVAYDDFRIHTRALTTAEHYQMFLTGEAPRDNLALEYLFDNDGSIAPQVVDTSGNGFHGTWQTLSSANYVQQQ